MWRGEMGGDRESRTWTETTNSSSPHTMETFIDRFGPFQHDPPVVNNRCT